MNDLFVWLGMTVLAVILAVVGPMKLQYRTYIQRRGSDWARDWGPTKTRLIGLLEVLIAVGIVWPLATQTLSWLSVVSCLGATVLLLSACILHTRRGETELAGLTGLLGILAAVVTLGIAF